MPRVCLGERGVGWVSRQVRYNVCCEFGGVPDVGMLGGCVGYGLGCDVVQFAAPDLL